MNLFSTNSLSFFLMMVTTGLGKSVSDYCGGIEPVDGRWGDFPGKCYVQRMISSQEESSIVSCKTLNVFPGDPPTQGLTISTQTVANITTNITYHWRDVANTSKNEMTDTLEGRPGKSINGIMAYTDAGYFLICCPKKGKKILAPTGVSLCTYSQNPGKDEIKTLIQMAVEKGFKRKGLVHVSQQNCPEGT